MDAPKDHQDLIYHLNAKGVEYLIVGGYAVAHHDKTRLPQDLDVWVKPDADNVAKAQRALAEFGAPPHRLEVGSVVRIGGTKYSVPIDIHLDMKGPSFETCWGRRRVGTVGKEGGYFLSLDDVIAEKREAEREKDQRDLKALEAVAQRTHHRRSQAIVPEQEGAEKQREKPFGKTKDKGPEFER